MIVWPADLPQSPERPTFAAAPASPALRTPMESGPPKQRRRYSGKWRRSPISWLMSSAQKSTFEAFVDATLQGGALRFTWPDPEGGADVQAQIIDGKYQAVNLGGPHWRVSCEMEWFG